MNTFHDGLKAWIYVYRHCVCQGSYLKYGFSIYKAKYDNRIEESPWRLWHYVICIISHGLCFYNARFFNDDVTTIGVTYWRRREFTNYAWLHHGRMVLISYTPFPLTTTITRNIWISVLAEINECSADCLLKSVGEINLGCFYLFWSDSLHQSQPTAVIFRLTHLPFMPHIYVRK